MKKSYKLIMAVFVSLFILPNVVKAAPIDDLTTCLAGANTNCTLDTSGGDVSLIANLTIPANKIVSITGDNNLIIGSNTLTISGKLYLGTSDFISNNNSVVKFGYSDNALIASGTSGSCSGDFSTEISSSDCSTNTFISTSNDYSQLEINIISEDISVGNGNLKINNDITIPAGANLTINNGGLIIPDGISLTNNGTIFGYVSVDGGTLTNNADGNNFQVEVKNNGKLINNADVSFYELHVLLNSSFENNGDVILTANGYFEFYGTITNNGSISFNQDLNENFQLSYAKNISGNPLQLNYSINQNFTDRLLYTGIIIDGSSNYYSKKGLMLYADQLSVIAFEALYNESKKEYNVLVQLPNNSGDLEILFSNNTNGKAIKYDLLETKNIIFFDNATKPITTWIGNDNDDSYTDEDGNNIYSQYMWYYVDDTDLPGYFKYKVIGANEGEELTINVATLIGDTPAIMFESNEGSFVKTIFMNEDGTFTKPTDPTKEGYTFAGWYRDVELTTKFDFNDEIDETTILYAKWVKNKDVNQEESITNPQTNDGIITFIVLSIISALGLLGIVSKKIFN